VPITLKTGILIGVNEEKGLDKKNKILLLLKK
jgi:hypothetical protein